MTDNYAEVFHEPIIDKLRISSLSADSPDGARLATRITLMYACIGAGQHMSRADGLLVHPDASYEMLSYDRSEGDIRSGSGVWPVRHSGHLVGPELVPHAIRTMAGGKPGSTFPAADVMKQMVGSYMDDEAEILSMDGSLITIDDLFPDIPQVAAMPLVKSAANKGYCVQTGPNLTDTGVYHDAIIKRVRKVRQRLRSGRLRVP